jgi:hypothetical protein
MNSGLGVLIVGGYGTFGGRIVELLENEPRLVLFIAGRSLERARAYCKTRDKAKAKLVPTTFDRDGDLSAHLVPLRPHVLVDASGPFQTYGQGRYRVIEACIAHGIHYLDLADGSDFVEGVHAFAPAARGAGVFVLSGVSSFPILTAAIHGGNRNAEDDGPSLYARLLGAAWHNLPAEIRDMHDVGAAASAKGRASVHRGTGLLARLAAAVIGFPRATADAPVSVQFNVLDRAETWTRTFGSESFSSRQFAGRGRSERLLCERFGPLTFAMALVPEAGRLRLVLRRWSAFGVPLPMWLCPSADSYESAEDGRFGFHVEISHPLTGLIVRYRGWLVRSR